MTQARVNAPYVLRSFSLDGEWQLRHFREGSLGVTHPDELPRLDLRAISAQVPGNVELDLARAGELEDPFYAENMSALRALEDHEWWYTRDFEVPADAGGRPQESTLCTWELVCAGLDTLASVWINGVAIGQSANMLIEHRFDVTHALRPGENNRIAVRLGSATNQARRFHYDPQSMSWEHREEGLFIRKAAHVWGWDIMPRAASAGIWRSVWIEERPANAIEQFYYWTERIDESGAILGVRFQFRCEEPVSVPRPRPASTLTGRPRAGGDRRTTRDLGALGLTLRFHGDCGGHSFEYEWPVEFIAGGCQIAVPGARLWWPTGYGEPALYTVRAQLCCAQRGEVLAERTDRVGIRTAECRRSEAAGASEAPRGAAEGVTRMDAPPSPENHFLFVVNGQPIMVKGSNWVPLDAFHSRDAGRVDEAVALFDDLGCNMIRCWGGNVYEDHRFFDLCDEKGIMVWQDFAFACCRYPQTEPFLIEVRQEAQAVVEKLRNHPSLVIWCGDNEVDMAYVGTALRPEQNRLTREVLPQVVHRCDPYRAFVPSSPYVPPSVAGRRANTPYVSDACDHTPEQHLWGPRGYYKGPYYTHHSAHFIGEIGYHGCPNVSSIRRFISPEKLWPWQENSEWQAHSVYHWRHHAIERDRIGLMANQVRELFGEIPDSLEAFALASQIVQAEAVKFFIESTRLRKWRTSGILWWNVIDGWPQFSDAVVDYYFGKKLAYHYIRRVQRPVCVVLGEPGTGKYLPVVVCNDSLRSVDVTYRVWDVDSGETVAEGAGRALPNENWQMGRIRTYAGERRLYVIEWQVEGERYGNRYLAGAPPLDLEQYRRWLRVIAGLPRPFDPEGVAR